MGHPHLRLWSDQYSLLQHAQNPITCRGGGQMLQGVTADDVAEGEDLTVGFLENLGEDVESHDRGEV
jgi:hypothetical protein